MNCTLADLLSIGSQHVGMQHLIKVMKDLFFTPIAKGKKIVGLQTYQALDHNGHHMMLDKNDDQEIKELIRTYMIKMMMMRE